MKVWLYLEEFCARVCVYLYKPWFISYYIFHLSPHRKRKLFVLFWCKHSFHPSNSFWVWYMVRKTGIRLALITFSKCTPSLRKKASALVLPLLFFRWPYPIELKWASPGSSAPFWSYYPRIEQKSFVYNYFWLSNDGICPEIIIKTFLPFAKNKVLWINSKHIFKINW